MHHVIKGIRHATSATFVAFALSSMTTASLADSEAVKASTEYVSLIEDISVNPDGSNITEWTAEHRLLDASGRDDVAQMTFRFNDQRSTIEVLEAETIKANGVRIKVKHDQIRLQEDPATIGVPMFSTSKMKTIIFPDVEVGDSIHYHVRKTETEPDFPGEFSYTDSTNPDLRILSGKLTIKAPASLKLLSKAVGYNETREIGPQGEQIWSWTFSQSNPRPFGDYKANVFFTNPHVVVTSFATWEELSVAQGAAYLDKTKVNAEIQALADKITEGTTDRREQTKRLYDWVRGNIRYVALYLSHGGYVPHYASDILHNRYGDCKDHVVLLEALLRAKGIESHGVVISSGEQLYEVGSMPTPYFFDHIITYIPEFDLYADATDQYLPFGELGYSLSGKQVLHIDKTTGLKQMPVLRAAANTQVTDLQLDLGFDGALKGKADIVSSGDVSLNQRYLVAGINPLNRADAVHDNLAQNGMQGNGTFTADKPETDGPSYRVGVEFTAEPGNIDLSGPEAIELQVPVFNFYTIAGATRFATELPDPDYPRACMAIDITDVYKVALPASTQVVVLPKPVSLMEGPIRYESTYESDHNEIRATRHYTMNIDRGYCTPQELEGMAKTAKIIRRDLHRKILLKPANS